MAAASLRSPKRRATARRGNGRGRVEEYITVNQVLQSAMNNLTDGSKVYWRETIRLRTCAAWSVMHGSGVVKERRKSVLWSTSKRPSFLYVS